jgi:hypothetical protein
VGKGLSCDDWSMHTLLSWYKKNIFFLLGANVFVCRLEDELNIQLQPTLLHVQWEKNYSYSFQRLFNANEMQIKW